VLGGFGALKHPLAFCESAGANSQPDYLDACVGDAQCSVALCEWRVGSWRVIRSYRWLRQLSHR
jgi:hypothetical protein